MNHSDEPKKPRILMVSQRNFHPNDLWRCPHYEFEDIVCQIDSVELLTPMPNKYYNISSGIAKFVKNNSMISVYPGISKIKLTKNYDILFLFCSFPYDFLNINLANNWRDYCKYSVCLVDEIWVKDILDQKGLLKLLSNFDHVMLYYSQSVKAVSEIIGRTCSYLPPGIDSIKFCPYPNPPTKVIDVYSIGRRSEATHKKLLEMVKEKNIFYVHDTISGPQAKSSVEHRNMFANMAKRSRFFIVNPGLIDRPERTNNQIEIPNRYFEGAAAGCILIGEIPKNEAFERLFNWPDSVVHLPFGSDNIDKIINEFDKQADRENSIRRSNIIQSLRRHDWVYRWESVLEIAGLDPMPGLLSRKNQLEKMAKIVEGETNNIWC
jgi:hypothetical protein